MCTITQIPSLRIYKIPRYWQWMVVRFGICIKKNSVNAAKGRVGMLIDPRVLKSLNSIEKIQPKMIVATFHGNPSTTIISSYSPTNFSYETDIIDFYNELSSLVRRIPKHNILLSVKIWMPKLRKNVNNKFSLHNSSSRNGEHLTDFTLRNILTRLNTKFQKRKGKLWTYTYANNTKAQIDHILINKK